MPIPISNSEPTQLNILNDSYGNIDSYQSTLLVALDLSAAFDTDDTQNYLLDSNTALVWWEWLETGSRPM